MINFAKNFALVGGLLQVASFGGGELSADASLAGRAKVSGRAAPSSGGLGLGLYVVHRAVEQLGVDLLVASEPGRGSRFAVHLLLA